MKNATIFPLLFLLFSCTGVPNDVSFKGTWKNINENLIMGVQEEISTHVITDGNRFRIENDHAIQVYDGTMFYFKTKEDLLPNNNNEDKDSFPASGRFQEIITPAKADQYRFWKKPTGLAQGPGSSIAGQKTVLYETTMDRADGKLGTQVWADARTGILLKSVNNVYSKQVQQIIARETIECTELDYHFPVTNDYFVKPQ